MPSFWLQKAVQLPLWYAAKHPNPSNVDRDNSMLPAGPIAGLCTFHCLHFKLKNVRIYKPFSLPLGLGSLPLHLLEVLLAQHLVETQQVIVHYPLGCAADDAPHCSMVPAESARIITRFFKTSEVSMLLTWAGTI